MIKIKYFLLIFGALLFLAACGNEDEKVRVSSNQIEANDSVKFGKIMIEKYQKIWSIDITNTSDKSIVGSLLIEIFDENGNLVISEHMNIEEGQLLPAKTINYKGNIDSDEISRVHNYKIKNAELHFSEYVEPEINEDEKFMEEYNINLVGKEVQFNLANNIDKEFYLNGNVELCDYYNYGYTNEKAYFCGKLTPVDGGYSDSWYLYFHRDSFDNVYQALLDGNINMRIIAKIPSNGYKRGQGNMAVVQRIEAY